MALQFGLGMTATSLDGRKRAWFYEVFGGDGLVTCSAVTPEEEHAFYSEPENLMPQGPAHRRNKHQGPDESSMNPDSEAS